MDQANGIAGELFAVAEHIANTRRAAISSVKSKDSETNLLDSEPPHLKLCNLGEPTSLGI